MSDAFLGEIRLVGWNFAPQNWALCNGQLLPVSNFAALFSLLNTTYGGDGRTNFALPNLNGVVPIGVGQAASGTTYQWGKAGGSESTILATTNLPAHQHSIPASTNPQDTTQVVSNAVIAGPTGSGRAPQGNQVFTTTPNATIAPTGSVGNGAPIDNRQPYLPMYYIICTNGIYPARP